MARKKKTEEEIAIGLSDTRLQAIESALSKIRKAHGNTSIMLLDDDGIIEDVEVIPTGSIGLDIALGVGGLPRGRLVELFGSPMGGKSTLACHVIAEAQKSGGYAAYIDAEHAMDKAYAKKLGVQVDRLLISQPDCGEQAIEIVEELVASNALDCIVVDSVAALIPKVERDGELTKEHIGLQARLMGKACRRLTSAVGKTKTVLLFINQIRQKIGVTWGAKETTPGGEALKFYSSVRLEVRAIDKIKRGEVIIGAKTRVKVVKNKVAPPFREAVFDLIYGEGIDSIGEIFDIAVDQDLIERHGAWFSYGDEKIGQGRENAKDFIRNNRELCELLKKEIRKEEENEVTKVCSGESGGDNSTAGEDGECMEV